MSFDDVQLVDWREDDPSPVLNHLKVLNHVEQKNCHLHVDNRVLIECLVINHPDQYGSKNREAIKLGHSLIASENVLRDVFINLSDGHEINQILDAVELLA